MRILLLLISSLFMVSCQQEAKLTELKGDIFGSYYIIKYFGDLEEVKFKKELDSFFEGFNNEFSTYQENSVISLLNRSGPNEKIRVSKRFILMLKMAQKFHRDTRGAFDPTLGPVIKAWGFGGGKTKARPTDKDLKQALSRVGFEHLHWDEKSSHVWKSKNIQLDVNAFAPGWACDLIGEILENHQIRNYMVDLSGDILFRGTKNDGAPWIAGIEVPSQEHAKGVQRAFKAHDIAISTSGNYRQFFDERGTRLSHIIDPRSGKPVEHRVSSASVISSSAAEADAWSTAMMVLGEAGLELAEVKELSVFLLRAKDPEVYEELSSNSMKAYIERNRL